MDHADQAEPLAIDAGRFLVVRQLVSDDSQDGVHLARLHGTWRVKVDGDEFAVQTRVAVNNRPQPALASRPTAHGTQLKTRHFQNLQRPLKKMFHQSLVARVDNVRHAVSLRPG